MLSGIQTEEKHFVEDMGLFFEQTGMPRMAGRILGWLLISDPSHQSLGELADALMASKGSISTNTRLLIQIGLIERLILPGVRHDYFRIRPEAWHQTIRQSLDRVSVIRQLAERGLKLIKGRDSLTRQWLEDARSMYRFFEKEFPALLQRWEKEHYHSTHRQVKSGSVSEASK